MGREEREGKTGEGSGREGGGEVKGREGSAPPIFYCTPSSSFLEICLNATREFAYPVKTSVLYTAGTVRGVCVCVCVCVC